MCQPASRGREVQGVREEERREEGPSEEVARAREYLALYSVGRQESSQIFEEVSYIKSDKFHLRLKPAATSQQSQ